MGLTSKIFGSADMKEIEQALEEDIYKRLVQETDRLKNYQFAINSVRDHLRKMVEENPSSKDVVSRAAESAGKRYLQMVDEVKKRHKMFESGVKSGMAFGNVTIKQSPPRNIDA